MRDCPTNRPRKGRRPRPPLDPTALEQLGLAYVARFATSAGKFEAYLRRKLRERGWEGALEPDIAGLSRRLVAAGYIDDHNFARARSSGLSRRGYGARRIDADLNAAGISEDIRAQLQADRHQERQSALTLARKRRLGPFAREAPDGMMRNKHLATLLRAGHRLDTARALIDSPSISAAEEWATMIDQD